MVIVAGETEGERLRQAAGDAGFDARTVDPSDAFAAPERLRRADVVLLTLGMEGGEPVLRRLRPGRGLEEEAAPLVVAVGESPAPVRALVDAVFPRPVGADELMARVRHQLAGAQVAIDRLAGATGDDLVPAPARPAPRLDPEIEHNLDGELSEAARALEPRNAPIVPPPASWSLDGGDLDERDLPFLLGAAHRNGSSGRLLFQRDGAEKSIFLIGGRPVMATSNDPRDRLNALLLRRGLLSEGQRAQAVTESVRTGRRLGALLVEWGWLTRADLRELLREHDEAIVRSLFTWQSGRYRFDPAARPEPDRVRLLGHPIAIVLEGLGERDCRAEVQARLGRGNRFRLVERAEARALLDELRAAEPARGGALVAQVAALFDGLRSVDEVLRAAGADDEEAAARLTLVLWIFDLLTPGQSAGRPRDSSLGEARLQMRAALAEEGDYFRFLGLAPDAGAPDIRRAQALIQRELELVADDPAASVRLQEPLALVRAVLAESVRVLGTPSLAARYRAALGTLLPAANPERT